MCCRYGRQWQKGKYNPTTGAFLGPGKSAPAGSGRISFCQAVGLYQSTLKGSGVSAVGGEKDEKEEERQQPTRTLDNASNTWRFDCDHDPRNASTWTSCTTTKPSRDAPQPQYEVWYDDAETLQPKMAAAPLLMETVSEL